MVAAFYRAELWLTPDGAHMPDFIDAAFLIFFLYWAVLFVLVKLHERFFD